MLKYWVAAALINLFSFGIGVFWGAIGVAAVSGLSFVLVQTPLVLYGALRSGPVRPIDMVRAIAPATLAAALTYAVIRYVPPLRFASDPVASPLRPESQVAEVLLPLQVVEIVERLQLSLVSPIPLGLPTGWEAE